MGSARVAHVACTRRPTQLCGGLLTSYNPSTLLSQRPVMVRTDFSSIPLASVTNSTEASQPGILLSTAFPMAWITTSSSCSRRAPGPSVTNAHAGPTHQRRPPPTRGAQPPAAPLPAALDMPATADKNWGGSPATPAAGHVTDGLRLGVGAVGTGPSTKRLAGWRDFSNILKVTGMESGDSHCSHRL